MRKIVYLMLSMILMNNHVMAQQVPYVISGGTLHIGDGTIIENGLLIIRNGKIEYAGVAKESGYDSNTASLIDATGKHIYPGFIGLTTELGLKEISAVRATRDVYEVGEFNPNIRSIIAYNTDSKVIPTVRSNGILLAQPFPNGGTISGQSSVVKLSGWNWEDAVVATDGNMHMHWPGIYRYNWETGTYAANPDYAKEVDAVKQFFQEAKAYCASTSHPEKNLRFEAMRKVFTQEQKLFIRTNAAKGIIGAVDLAKEFGLQIVIVGGRQSYQVLALLKENNIPVLLESTHELPENEGDPIDLPYRLPAILRDAGIMCGLTINNEDASYWNLRNLPFQAGATIPYGMPKEEAVKMITLNNAKIAGIDAQFGTLSAGKSATLFISEGDALDIRTNQMSIMFIAGERIKPENWQDEQEHKYQLKYGITPRN